VEEKVKSEQLERRPPAHKNWIRTYLVNVYANMQGEKDFKTWESARRAGTS
jgi:hypothetical protein